MLKKKVKNKSDFIKKAINIHGGKFFDYSKSIFVNEDSPIIIRCLQGHLFLMVAKNHLQGEPCPNCKELTARRKYEDHPLGKFLSKEKNNVFKSFIGEIYSIKNSKNLLEISFSNKFFVKKKCIQLHKTKWIREIGKGKNFDFIFGEFLTANREKIYKRGSEKIKVISLFANILCSLQFLEKNGIALFAVPEIYVSVFVNKKGKMDLESLLNSEGYYLNAIFRTPLGLFGEKILRLGKKRIIVVLITRNNPESVFLGELLNEDQSKNLVKNYFKKKSKGNFKNGILIPNGSFKGFDLERIDIEIGKLNEKNKTFENFKLKELAAEINILKPLEKKGGQLVRTKHKEKKNSIYINIMSFGGDSFNVLSKASDIPAENNTYHHHRYIQIVLNEKTTNKYLSSYFKSDFGKLILQSISKPWFNRIHIPHLENISIVLPSLENQREILGTLKKLDDLKEKIDNFDAEIAINFSSTKEISSNVDNMLEILGRLTESDRIMSLIRQGESDKLEFKETLSLDLKKNSKEKYIEESVLKTIVAFLNKEGGILLIGVNDKGLIKGIEGELKRLWKNMDKFLQHFKNIRRDRIGINYDIYIDIKPLKVDKKTIVKVECSRSNVECYLDEEDFYLRTNPANEKLTGRRLSEYIQERFR